MKIDEIIAIDNFFKVKFIKYIILRLIVRFQLTDGSTKRLICSYVPNFPSNSSNNYYKHDCKLKQIIYICNIEYSIHFF